MIKYRLFLQWWLFMVLVSIGMVGIYKYGIFHTIFKLDITYITGIILILFVYFSFRIGYGTYRGCKSKYVNYNAETILRWADRLPTLGIIGTVIGLIYLFSTAKLGSENTQVIIIGMGTALYTTAAGLICKFLLDLQVDNFINCEEIKCRFPNDTLIA